jgi:hypothetical protein
VEDRPQGGLSPGGRLIHHVDQLLHVRGVAAGANQCADFAVEGDQPDAVLLIEHQIGQRRGRALRILEFRHRGRLAAIRHALAGVEQQVRNQVRLFLELLQVILVGPPENLPVEVAKVVARHVLAMFGEFDGEPVKRAAVDPGNVPLDDQPRAKLQPPKFRQPLRIEIFLGVFDAFHG